MVAAAGVSMGRWSPKDYAERARDVVAVAAAGFTWLRATINWSGSEKTPGVIYTQQATDLGNACAAAGIALNVVFAYAPPIYTGGVAGNAPPTPDHYDEWQRWVTRQAEALELTGVRWAAESWNEPDNDQFFHTPNPAVYVQLLRLSARAVRSVNPQRKVVFGGLAPARDVWPNINPLTFVRKCYEAGMTGSDYDHMNLHPYAGGLTMAELDGEAWDMNSSIYDDIVAEMTKHGDGGKKVRCTEFGYNTAGDRHVTPEAKQGQLIVAQFDKLRRKPTAGPTFVFSWRNLMKEPSTDPNANYGLHYFDGRPKPGFAVVRDYLTG